MSGRRRVDLRLGLSLQRSSAAPYDPAVDNLSLWLRSENLSGTGATLAWAGKASAGSSAANGFGHAVSDEVVLAAGFIDGYDAAYWQNTAGQPRLDSVASGKLLRSDILGQGDSVGASYTACYVGTPVSSNRYDLTGGTQTGLGNPAFLGEQAEFFSHAIMSDGGACKVGVSHYDATLAVTGGTTPMVWAGGFGVLGLMWVSYDLGAGTVTVRVKTAGNAGASLTESIPIPRIPVGWHAEAQIGSIGGGGDIGELYLAEAQVRPGVALSGAQMAAIEQGYFKARYPSLGL